MKTLVKIKPLVLVVLCLMFLVGCATMGGAKICTSCPDQPKYPARYEYCPLCGASLEWTDQQNY
jgi:hypothetical protein